MRRCEDCKHSECLMPITPELPDLWICKARGGMGVLHPVLRALTCMGFESRYRLARYADLEKKLNERRAGHDR